MAQKSEEEWQRRNKRDNYKKHDVSVERNKTDSVGLR